MHPLQRDESVATESLRNDARNPAGARYDALLDVLPVGVFLLDGEQRIRSVNPAGARLLGVEPGALVGRRCHEVLQCSTDPAACATCRARSECSTHRNFPTEVRRGDGSRRSMHLDAVPLDDGVVAVLLRDVTEEERMRRALRDRWVFHGLTCVSQSMKEIVGRVRDVAPYDATVLILGESGTGKELIARALHAESLRASRPFVAVNCSAYSENLLESELFGHVRGSFTGADRDRRGRFEMADGGTVFLDEIGEISPKIQVKLLRVLQEREIERVGENRSRRVDLRVVAATNRDLRREVREGRFREDLYYRLNVFTITLPPLRDRREDIPVLADTLLERLAERTGKEVRTIAPDVLEMLARHSWPGNVRELENVLESALVRARGGTLTAADLPDAFQSESARPASPEERLRAALERSGGCVTRAARLLGVHRTTLWRQMREAGLRREDFLPA